jgi:hypothetical protein
MCLLVLLQVWLGHQTQETVELNSNNTGNIERQSLDSSIAESEKKKKGE